jgi:hypothetical protein
MQSPTPAPCRLHAVPSGNWWELRWGKKAAPIIIEAADGAGTVTFPGANINGCKSVLVGWAGGGGWDGGGVRRGGSGSNRGGGTS